MKKKTTLEDLRKRVGRLKGKLFYNIGVIEEIQLILYKIEQQQKKE